MKPSGKILCGALVVAFLALVATAILGRPHPPAPPEAPEQAAVSKCQKDVDSLMAGKTINFRSGSAYLAPASLAVIKEVAAVLKPCAGMHIEVQGHSDLKGAASINLSMSQARADAVMQGLVDAGIPAGQLSAKGYGSTQPLEQATTPEANARNRRTIFKVTAGNVVPSGGQ